jgi:hypothetical protein
MLLDALILFPNDQVMRTTLDIEPEVLAAAKEIALRERTSAGAVISRLARAALVGEPQANYETSAPYKMAKGFDPFPAAGAIITNEHIDALRDLEGI